VVWRVSRVDDGSALDKAAALHTKSFRLTYADCDPAGIIFYASYYRWMEHLHTEWWFLQGVRMDQILAERGVVMYTRHSSGNYRFPPTLFDLLEGRIALGRIGRTSFRLDFSFTLPNAVVAATGEMVIVTADADRRPVPVPDWARELLASRS
jgi:YbgC/YbaW family acyl-CoA thioester hydrolase